MKKFIFTIATALTVALAGCSGSDQKTDENEGTESEESTEATTNVGAPKTFEDSLTVAFTEMQISEFNKYLNSIPEDKKAEINNAEVLKGIKAVLGNDNFSEGYMYGLQLGLEYANQMKSLEESTGVNLNKALLLATATKVMGKEYKPEEIEALQNEMQQFSMRLQEKAVTYNQKKSEENTKAGNEYINKIKASDSSIKTTATGLAYKVIKEGNGAKPGAMDKVKVIYTGKLIDGSTFDSSNGQPVEFQPAATIPGFSEGLQMMSKGSKYTLYIPGELAYGQQGIQGVIPPNATLVFEVELVDIEK